MQVFTNVSTWSEFVKMVSQLSHTVTEPQAVHKIEIRVSRGIDLKKNGSLNMRLYMRN
jgi:hypothetical protein